MATHASFRVEKDHSLTVAAQKCVLPHAFAGLCGLPASRGEICPQFAGVSGCTLITESSLVDKVMDPGADKSFTGIGLVSGLYSAERALEADRRL